MAGGHAVHKQQAILSTTVVISHTFCMEKEGDDPQRGVGVIMWSYNPNRPLWMCKSHRFLVSFSGLHCLQSSMQIWRGKVWKLSQCESREKSRLVDTHGVTTPVPIVLNSELYWCCLARTMSLSYPSFVNHTLQTVPYNMLTTFEVTTMTTMDSACLLLLYNSHLLDFLTK